MRLVVLDFETHYSADYSLSKMSPLEYVRDPRFQLISCSIKVDDHPSDVFFGHDKISHAFSKLGAIVKDAITVAHNMSGFDAYVCAYVLGLRPKLWGCTLAMARPIHAKTVGLGLAALVKHYQKDLEAMGIAGVKDGSVLVQTRGKRLEDFTPSELEAMRTYNRNDTDQCWGLFKLLRKHYTPAELWQIDALIRMRTEPQFELDVPLLETAASVERSRKHAALIELATSLRKHATATEGADDELDWSDEDAVAESVRSELASAPKFSALLERLGVEVPMKPSPTNPEKLAPALAKTDEAFTALQDHENPLVAAAARARLGVKSTLLEKRIDKFRVAGRFAGGRLPVPLRYCGADTTGRDSGEEYNCFTGDVEVLTPAGWVRFDAWKGEPIMQWWPDGRASFEAHPGVLRKRYKGPMVDVRGVLLDATMTPEHRLVSVRARGVVERPAQYLLEHSGLDGIPASGVWDGEHASLFTPAEARLMVAIAADGCTVSRKTEAATIQIGLRRGRKIERMRTLLRAVGCDYSERQYAPQEAHKGEHDTIQFVLPRCKYHKGLGPWLLQLNREALDAAADEFVHWDGRFHTKTGAHEFSSSSKEEAEWVSLVWHLSGTPATVRCYRGSLWQVHRRMPGSGTSVSRHQVEEVLHDGEVFCASVESTYIFVRRNGKIAVTGQCQNLPRIDPDKPKVSDALRKSLRAPKGKKVIVADQTGIELRVNHFLWKVPSSMELYRASPDKADLYRAFAAESLFKVKPEEIGKSQRQLGKMCILEGTLVLTRRGEVPIEQVSTSDLVWDGVEWVHTDGPIFKGVKDVIHYDGLAATTDHDVWIEDGRKVPFGLAAAQSLRLARTGAGRVPMGFGGTGEPGDFAGQRVQVRQSALYGLRGGEGGLVHQPAARQNTRLPELFPEVRSPAVAASTSGGGAAALHEPEGSRVPAVRGERGTVSVRVCGRSGGVGSGEPGAVPHQGAGPHNQLGALRAGQLALGDAASEHRQSGQEQVAGFPPIPDGAPGGTVRGQHTPQSTVQGYDVSADSGAVGAPVVQAQGRVWDLLNCGPRNRFTAGGRLVSNCQLGLGFGAGGPAFQRVARTMGGIRLHLNRKEYDGPELTAEEVVSTWRETYAPIVQGWRSCARGVLWIADGAEHAVDPWELVHTCSEGFVLPSGRLIRYPDLREEDDGEWPDGRKRRSWFYGRGRHKARITGPKACENIVQALARDSIFDCSVEYFKQTGLRPALRVHDELVYVVDEGVADELLANLQAIMRQPPKWWPQLVVWSEGDAADTYGDAK